MTSLSQQARKQAEKEKRMQDERARHLLREQDKRLKRKAYQRECRLIHEYGITQYQYDKMQGNQNGRCCICGAKLGNRRLHVDHCHESGEVRGLLCSRCNTGLGMFRDDPELLLKAIGYLESPPGVPKVKQGNSRKYKYRRPTPHALR